jgi:hypothetical protein
MEQPPRWRCWISTDVPIHPAALWTRCRVLFCPRRKKVTMFKIIEIFVLGYKIRKEFAKAAAKPTTPVAPPCCGYCGAEDPYSKGLECYHCGGN